MTAILGLWLAWACVALPSLWDYLLGNWSAYSQGHEVLFLLVCAVLLRKSAKQAQVLDRQLLPEVRAWWWMPAWCLALVLYALGRSQELLRLELLAVWLLAMLIHRLHLGPRMWRLSGFAWLFALLAMPLPFAWVLALTAPLKLAVSVVACKLLSAMGLPIGRSGVIITAGQYQLLVAEACAGLHSMFMLEAMGLLYSHLAPAASRWRKLALAAAAIPIAFVANVVRVMVLVWVTLVWGDAAGQGFVHRFAGLLLFVVALALLASLDAWLVRLERRGAWGKGKGNDKNAEKNAEKNEEKNEERAPTRLAPPLAWRPVLGLCVSLVLAAALSGVLRPQLTAQALQRANTPLESLVPSQFAGWRLATDAAGVVQPAFERARQFQMYDQVLERVYRRDDGRRVMLSVAYGRQQSVGLQMHRPEVCYRAGGFEVSQIHQQVLRLGAAEPPAVALELPVVQLLAAMPGRAEPLTYWRLLGDRVVASDAEFHWQQLSDGLLRHALRDGMLVRVSTIDGDAQRAWQLQAQFIDDLARAMDVRQRARVMGHASDQVAGQP